MAFTHEQAQEIKRTNPQQYAWLASMGMIDKDAEAAYGIADQSGKAANDAFGRQMEGLDKSIGVYGDANDAYNNLYGHDTGPSHAEDAYSNYGSDYLKPTQSDSTLNGLRSYASQPSQADTYGTEGAGYVRGANNQQSFMPEMTDWSRAPSNSENNYANTDSALGAPSETSKQWESYKPEYNSTGAMEQYGNDASNALGVPGAYEDYFNNNKGQYGGTSDVENLYNGSAGREYNTSGKAENFQAQSVNNFRDYAGDADKRLSQAGQLNTEGNDIRGYFSGANDVQRFSGQNAGTLGQAGMYEQFAQQAMDGTNPYLDRIRKLGNANMNQQLAKRGQFSSGGAAAAIGNYNSGLDAEAYNQLAELAKGGQSMQLQRLGQGQGLAQAASGERMGQGSALQGLATGRESEYMNREDARRQTALGSSQENLASQGLGLQAATAADQSRMSRLSGQTNLANLSSGANLARKQAGDKFAYDAQTANNTRVKTLGDIKNLAQSRQLDRMAGGIASGKSADDSFLARSQERRLGASAADDSRQKKMDLRQKTANELDTHGLSQAQKLLDLGKGIDSSYLDQFKEMGLQSDKVDTQRRQGLDSYFSGATGADTGARNRKSDQYQAAKGLADSKAGLISGAYGTGGSLASGLTQTQLKGLSDALGVQITNENDLKDFLKSLTGRAIGNLTSPKPGAGGAA